MTKRKHKGASAISKISSLTSEWQWPVGLWIPNLCTYIRIAACGKAFAVAFTDKKLFTVLIIVCFVANELSRHIASYMKLSSMLGDVLVNVSSRISNTGLLLILSHLYKRDYKVVLLLLELDIASQWLRMYCEVMNKRSHCHHLETYQNFLHHHPLFQLFCAVSQEVMYISLYLVAFEWMEQGQFVKLDFQKLKRSKYCKSLAMAAPGFILRQIVILDEIRVATGMCVHFDNQPNCRDKAGPVPQEPDTAPPAQTSRRQRRRSRSLSRARNRSRSRLKFDQNDDIAADY